MERYIKRREGNEVGSSDKKAYKEFVRSAEAQTAPINIDHHVKG